MNETHLKIVQEILQEYKLMPETLAINLMGSLSRGEGNVNSDIDIEIVTKEDKREFGWKVEEKYGIKIDFILSSRGQVLYQVENYPFFCLHMDKKPLYDPLEFMADVKHREMQYLSAHPEVPAFWEKKIKLMKECKATGKKKESLRDIFDESERLFSKTGKVTRDWFRK